METSKEHIPMLELMLRPAFSVIDGRVAHINKAASCYLITAGTDINSLIAGGAEDYAAFTEGCLYLTLSIGNQTLRAEVVSMDGYHIFLPEQPSDLTELKALALAASELRIPLAGMLTSANRIFPNDPDSNDKIQPQVAHFNHRMYQLMRIVSNMSDAADYCQSNGRIDDIEICGFLQELLQKAQELLSSIDVKLEYSLPNTAIYTMAEAERLERAVYNLISNAAKHTPQGGSICVRLNSNANRLHLSVTDSGIGLHDSARGNVYTRYLRTPSPSDGMDGIGLGMVLVRATAISHGGTVLIDHPQDGGTRVTMTMAIRHQTAQKLRSPILRIDYAGERDHGLQELSDVLPASAYGADKIL